MGAAKLGASDDGAGGSTKLGPLGGASASGFAARLAQAATSSTETKEYLPVAHESELTAAGAGGGKTPMKCSTGKLPMRFAAPADEASSSSTPLPPVGGGGGLAARLQPVAAEPASSGGGVQSRMPKMGALKTSEE